MTRKLQLVALVASLVLCLVIGRIAYIKSIWCDTLRCGRVIPMAVLKIDLPQPLSTGELYALYKRAAELGGHTQESGGPYIPDPQGLAYRRGHRWLAESTGRHLQEIRFSSPRAPMHVSSNLVTFNFNNDSVEKFDADDWLRFFEWKDKLLPQVFPNSNIRITRHPAARTKRDDIAKIELQTGLIAPERYKKPTAFLKIDLAQSLSTGELYARYKQAAELGGHTQKEGGPYVPDPQGLAYRRGHRWLAQPTGRYLHAIRFYSRAPMGVPSESVIFMMHNDSVEKFDADDWLRFFEWKDKLLPQVFPNSNIHIARHPAARTKREDIAKIELQTGLIAPERYKKPRDKPK